jgi:hypothetical protein
LLIYEYDGQRGRWIFDPGDGGNAPKPIELHPYTPARLSVIRAIHAFGFKK